MSKEIYISSTPHETRLAIVENDALSEIYYERANEYTLAGSIYNGKVTRVLPGMQSSFVDIGLDRDAFLYITDFMEEAGDSADFDSASQNGDSRRASRSDNGDNRRGSRDERANRSGQAATDRGRVPEVEPSDAEMFTQAVAGAEPRRSVDSDRNGNRRGGRGRRDRTNNSDGTPRRERNERDRATLADTRSERSDPGEEAKIIGEPIPAEDSVELGSGAPGADGSRRWRGRRGRRGSRHEAPRTGTPIPAEENLSSVENEKEPFEQNFAEPQESGSRGDADSRNNEMRRDRGGRNATPRMPRGFTPTASLYQVDGAAEAENGDSSNEVDLAAAEPMILPGESLSKYRPGGTTTPAAGPAETAAPASDFTVSGWDGGTVLPGETLRPRVPRPAEGVSANDEGESRRRDSRGGRRDRGERDSRRSGRGGRSEGNSDRQAHIENRPRRIDYQASAAVDVPAVEAAPADDAHQHVAQGAIELQENNEATETHTHNTIMNSTFVPPPPMPEHRPAADDEYEPKDASASYRLDPVAPSEYRQAAPVVQEELEAEAPRHEFTSIFASGEMQSEPVALATQEATAPSEMQPVRAEPMTAETAAADQSLPYFAPGSGVLEEEMLEDEMLEDEDGCHAASIAAVHAGTDKERRLHADEQETLEGGADLGSMLREMSIDQITHSEPTILEEDDDLDDDFLEEDQDYETEESGAMRDSLDEDSRSGHDLAEAYPQQDRGTNESGSLPEHASHEDDGMTDEPVAGGTSSATEPRRNDRSRDDRGRRDGRRGDRSRRPSDRGGADRGRRDGPGRPSVQASRLPAISDLLKPGQEVLVQIAKEPIAKKGARITSHIALPGRFLVFMPTVHHTGVSRKIESDGERRRLKEILLSERGEASGGFIVRTAAANASEEELRSDLRFLLNLWSDIKARSEGSNSPALIYHDLNLVERVLRDQVTDNFSAIWVDTEGEYERVLRFLQRFQPSLIRRVKLYTKETPLFEQFGITEEINKALRSKVWLKSGGSIVINQTEALVAIDINTGKFVGKTARLEDTIVKTNLDAIPEIVRQIRLRDLGGIIIIDFIDMDERKNRNRVMAALEEELKTDRAPSKVLQFNDFGLVAITRKRVKQSLERTLSTTCGVCQGTGMTKSPVTVCNDIYVELRKMHKHLDRGDIMLRVHPDVVKQLKSTTSRWLQEMEEMVGKTILVKSDPSLHPEQFDLH